MRGHAYVRRREAFNRPDGQLRGGWKDAKYARTVHAEDERDPAWVLGGRYAVPPAEYMDTPHGTSEIWKEIGRTDGVEVILEANYHLSNVGAQMAPTVHVRQNPTDTDVEATRLGVYIAPDITIGASMGATGAYLHTVEDEPFTTPAGQLGTNIIVGYKILTGQGWHDASRWRIVAYDGKVSGYVWNVPDNKWDRIVGPIALADVCPDVADVDGWGMWVCDGDGTPESQSVRSLEIRSYDGPDLGTKPSAPTLVVGDPVKKANDGSIALPYPADLHEGDWIFALVASTNSGPWTGPAEEGWERTTFGGGVLSNRVELWTKQGRATGDESGTVTFQRSSAANHSLHGVIFAARGANPWMPHPLGADVAAPTPTAAPTHTGSNVWGLNERKIWFSFTNGNATIGAPDGWTAEAQTEGGSSGHLVLASKEWTVHDEGRFSTGSITGTCTPAANCAVGIATLFVDPRETD